mmetsp:Transcript_103951/g.180627  ORF Transcript_103951/g.180627 Transcript_103951/m.180627 type:complete len:209 (-) Transcript_103951:147-773(-)
MEEVQPSDQETHVPQQEAVDIGGEGEAFEVLGELRATRRGPSVTWWESSTTETLSDPEILAEYMFDSLSEDTSVSSTRCSTNGTGTTGSFSRVARGRGVSAYVIYHGTRSPHSSLDGRGRLAYRGRSVTRRERSLPGAANRHRHPTHTPSRGVSRRAVHSRLHRTAALNAATAVAAHRLSRLGLQQVPHGGFHELGRAIGEEPAEGGQ